MHTSSCLTRATLCALLLVILIPASSQAADEPAVLYEKALQQFNKDKLPSAAINLKQALQGDPRFLAAHVLLARVYLKQFDGAQAEKELRLAQHQGADRSLVMPLLAQAYAQQRKYGQILAEIHPGNFDHQLNARLLVMRGDAQRELGQNDQAILSYDEAARYDSASLAPLLGQALALMSLGRFDKAETLVDRALDLDPKDADAWYTKGSIAHARAQLQQALKHYSHALDLDPENYTVRVARAGVFMDQGKDGEALKDLEYLYDEEAYDPQVPYLLGVARARLGDIEGSQAAMQKASAIITALPAEVTREHGESLLLASLVEYSLGEWEKALDHLKEYVKRYPGNPGARKLLGSILFDKGYYDAAIRVLEPALEQLPNDYRLLTLMGKAYLKKGWSVVALEMLDRAVTAGGTGQVEARTQLGLAQLASGKDEAGMEQLGEVFSQNEDARQAGIALVMEHLKRGENRAAAEVARLLSQRNPDNLELLNLLAGAEVAAGDLAGARGHYEQILKRDPTILVPAINLAKIDQAEGKRAQALARLDELSKRYAGNDLVLVERAHLEESLGHREKAIDLVEKAVAINESALPHQLYLGALYLKQAAYEQLDQLGQKLERLFPGNPRVKRLIGRGFLARDKLVAARLEFQNMSKLAGEDAQVFVEAASLSRAAGDLEWAAWSLNNAVKLKPQWLEPRLALAEVYLEADKQAKAADVLSYLLNHYPEHPATHRLAGDLAMAQGEVARAIDSYRLALQEGGGQDVALRLFQAYLASNDTEAGVGFLEERLKTDGGTTRQPLLALALAEGYLRLERIPAAQVLYEQLLTAGLQDAGAFNNLAMIYARQGDSRALEMARKAHQLAPESAMISDTLGWQLAKAGQPAEGLRHLRNAHLQTTSSLGIRYHIAAALAKLGRTDEARRELGAILVDDTPFASRADAEVLLGQLDAQ